MTDIHNLLQTVKNDREKNKYIFVLYKEDGMCWVKCGEAPITNKTICDFDEVLRLRDAIERAQRLLSVCSFDEPVDCEDYEIVFDA